MSLGILSGYWKFRQARIVMMQSESAVIAQAENCPAWKEGTGTIAGTALEMNFTGGPTAASAKGTVSDDGNSVNWESGLSWMRTSFGSGDFEIGTCYLGYNPISKDYSVACDADNRTHGGIGALARSGYTHIVFRGSHDSCEAERQRRESLSAD